MRRLAFLLMLLSLPSFAATDKRVFDQPCDTVWKAALAVGKAQYRLLGTVEGEQTLSVATGGNLSGERIITLTLKPDGDQSCTGEAQTRYMWGAGDGRNLLARIRVELVGEESGKDSRAFKQFRQCVEGFRVSEEKCEAKFRKATAQ